MKLIKLLILSLFLIISILNCASIKSKQTSCFENLQMIRFKTFDHVVYDWYDTLQIKGSYCIYYKNAIGSKKTNYIYGRFTTLTYSQYLAEKN